MVTTDCFTNRFIANQEVSKRPAASPLPAATFPSAYQLLSPCKWKQAEALQVFTNCWDWTTEEARVSSFVNLSIPSSFQLTNFALLESGE
jgi:hypothetical protein